MKSRSNLWLPIALVAVFAVTRWPGLLPPNFSAAYAIAFCAGVYFAGRIAWFLPLLMLIGTDLVLNCYYWLVMGINAFRPNQLVNYVAFAMLIWLGRRFRPGHSIVRLTAGGLAGAAVFYLITNTAAWFFNPFGAPEYTRDLAGWITALTKGTSGHPQTWEFFRNTLLSGGLFTGLFAGSMKLAERLESPQETEPVTSPSDDEEGEPAGNKAGA